jgi:hypothetical protein
MSLRLTPCPPVVLAHDVLVLGAGRRGALGRAGELRDAVGDAEAGSPGEDPVAQRDVAPDAGHGPAVALGIGEDHTRELLMLRYPLRVSPEL